MITTLIPTYRRPELLKRAIWSVLNQGVEHVRVCVFDNASEDATREIVRRLSEDDPRVTYHSHESNIGSIANFNFALASVETPFFSVLSDDDMLLPGFYTRALCELSGTTDASFYCGRSAVFDISRDTVRSYGKTWRAGLYKPTEHAILRMIAEHFPWGGILFRRSVLDSIGRLDASGSDDNFVVMASAQHPFIVSDSHTAVFFNHPGGFTGGLLNAGSQSSGDGPSAYLGELISRPHQLQAEILASPHIDLETKLAAVGALSSEMRKDLLAYFLFMVMPAHRPAEMQVVREALDSVGLSVVWRLLLTVFQLIARRGGLLAVAQARISRTLVTARDARRARRSRRDPLDAWVRREVAQAADAAARL
ncbi:MAG TPA: glycosyltransferase family 2 protein [Chloroflexota bacterium]|nr:glycosyltransferase family 2 protein [Chloroflexota bacterium]